RGEGGKDVQRVETRRDLEYWMPRLPDHVFQEWVAGTEFSIDWFATRDGVPRVVSPRERLEVRGGEVMKSRIRQDPQVIAAVTRVGKDLRLAGPATVQGILDKNHRFWLTDVNLRFGSGYVHTLAAGADVPLLIHRELSGGSIADVPLTARDGSVMVRYPEHLLL
ncbi:MAG: ATP-grasp domain-containing protein, partial [Nitrospinaceae bacterium]